MSFASVLRSPTTLCRSSLVCPWKKNVVFKHPSKFHTSCGRTSLWTCFSGPTCNEGMSNHALNFPREGSFLHAGSGWQKILVPVYAFDSLRFRLFPLRARTQKSLNATDSDTAGSVFSRSEASKKPCFSRAESTHSDLERHDPLPLLMTVERRRSGEYATKMFKNMFTTASEGARRSAFLTPKLVIRRNEQVKRRFPTTLAEGQYAVLPAQPVPEGIPKPPYACSQDGRSDDLRSSEEEKPGEVQTSEAIEKIKAACVVAANALKLGLRAAQEGATTEDLDRVVHEYIVSVGAYPAAVNFHNFPKAVCASVNEAVCHGIPNLRPLQSGDIITLDCTAYVDGYFGDCAGTAMIGDVLPTHRKLVVTTQACLEEAIKVVQPGVPISEVGRCIHTLATGRGFSVVREFCGHFIGRRMHLPPLISHVYRAPDTTPIATKLCHFRRLCCLLPANDTEGVFRSGQTLTIEPILCEGAADLYTWRDGWTIVTQDGGRAAQFEHTLLVTEKGAEVLTLPTV